MTPVRERCSRMFFPDAPNSSISPPLGSDWPVTIRIRVVLPAPLRPTRP